MLSILMMAQWPLSVCLCNLNLAITAVMCVLMTDLEAENLPNKKCEILLKPFSVFTQMKTPGLLNHEPILYFFWKGITKIHIIVH